MPSPAPLKQVAVSGLRLCRNHGNEQQQHSSLWGCFGWLPMAALVTWSKLRKYEIVNGRNVKSILEKFFCGRILVVNTLNCLLKRKMSLGRSSYFPKFIFLGKFLDSRQNHYYVISAFKVKFVLRFLLHIQVPLYSIYFNIFCFNAWSKSLCSGWKLFIKNDLIRARGKAGSLSLIPGPMGWKERTALRSSLYTRMGRVQGFTHRDQLQKCLKDDLVVWINDTFMRMKIQMLQNF